MLALVQLCKVCSRDMHVGHHSLALDGEKSLESSGEERKSYTS